MPSGDNAVIQRRLLLARRGKHDGPSREILGVQWIPFKWRHVLCLLFCLLLRLSLEQSSSPARWFPSSAAYQNHLESFFFFFWPHHMTCGILVPGPGFKPVPPALGAQNLNHWTIREVLHLGSFKKYWFLGLDHRDCDEVNSPQAQTESWEFLKLSRWF